MTGSLRLGGKSGGQQSSTSPFSVRVLGHGSENSNDASGHDLDQLRSLLPAPYRNESGDLTATSRLVTAYMYVEKKFDLQRLASAHGRLRLPGLPVMLPRARGILTDQ